jgi:HSP20 family molecular chaperone IbpA
MEPDMQQPSTSSPTNVDQSHRPKFVAIDHLKSRINALRDRIARRAFEIFQRHGSSNGSDLDDWLQAEAELCQRVQLEVTELDDTLIVHAVVSVFSVNELEVCIEPLRLIITGERDAKGDQSSSDQILIDFGLPTPVDPSSAAATLQNEILEIVMAKASRSLDLLFGGKQDSIVLAEDSRAWAESFAQIIAFHRDISFRRQQQSPD